MVVLGFSSPPAPVISDGAHVPGWGLEAWATVLPVLGTLGSSPIAWMKANVNECVNVQ